MQPQSRSGSNIHIHTCTLTSSCLLGSEDDRFTHITHTMLTLILACTSTPTSQGSPLLNTFRSAFITCTHKQMSTGDLVDDDTHTSMPSLDCLHKYTCILWCVLFPLTGAFPLYSYSVAHNSTVWVESSQQRWTYCRLYCETSQRRAHVLQFSLRIILYIY